MTDAMADVCSAVSTDWKYHTIQMTKRFIKLEHLQVFQMFDSSE